MEIENGLIRAPWVCGLGTVPFGFTTYAPSTCERKHRTIKSLLKSGYERCNAAELMHQVCEVVAGRIEAGHYNNLVHEISKEWQGLEKWPMRRNSARFDVCHIQTGEEES